MTGGRVKKPRRMRPRRVIITLQVMTDVSLSRLRAKMAWSHDDLMNGRVFEVEEMPAVNVVKK